MGYLREFAVQINKRDYSKCWTLWEEYCANDTVDAGELIQILDVIKGSDFAPIFGPRAEDALTIWEMIEDEEQSFEVFRRIIDLQTTNNPLLAEKALAVLNERFSGDSNFEDWLRIVGLRECQNFQGALSNYALLRHMAIGNCVYHAGGWGTGEIVDYSKLLEQIVVEFEYVGGRKHFTHAHAFKNLVPLKPNHFLSRRFLDPDTLEAEARENPVEVIKLLLKDLGAKSASEIKDELCEVIIPEAEWPRWWQATRTKLKKDTMIKTPDSLREPFELRRRGMAHEDRFVKELEQAADIFNIIQTSYNFVRDFPHMLKKDEVSCILKDKILALLDKEEITLAETLQIYIFMETLFNESVSEEKSVKAFVIGKEKIGKIVEKIDIIAFKKRALTAIREHRADWADIFLFLLPIVSQGQLRDYIFGELYSGETRERLLDLMKEILQNPVTAPEMTLWYFQKVMGKESEELPYGDKEGICSVSDAIFVLLHKIEHIPQQRDLAKKIYNLLTNKRYAVIREILEGSSPDFCREFLLLASKIHMFAGDDITIFHSLVLVVHPQLENVNRRDKENPFDGKILWTTEEGYRKTQERAQQLGTVEIVRNAKEVEEARALGDLSENAEYKFAVERRRNLQTELKTLLEQINRARIITDQDIHSTEAGVGSVVEIADPAGNRRTFSILGPWDADADKNILSFQSRLAQNLIGLHVGDTFQFKEEEYTIISLRSYLEDASKAREN